MESSGCCVSGLRGLLENKQHHEDQGTQQKGPCSTHHLDMKRGWTDCRPTKTRRSTIKEQHCSIQESQKWQQHQNQGLKKAQQADKEGWLCSGDSSGTSGDHCAKTDSS
ncbi:hypothetical protein AMECASPLE_009976 [Ameca splendens]|uniref:Uncharacterized protein n=1 Tax=Ameca splendens TaxID=208324 RepID=A0ABV0ZXH5_9TELE